MTFISKDGNKDSGKIGALSIKVEKNDVIYINDDKILLEINEGSISILFLKRKFKFELNQKAYLTKDIRVRAEQSREGKYYLKFWADQKYVILKERLYLRSKATDAPEA